MIFASGRRDVSFLLNPNCVHTNKGKKLKRYLNSNFENTILKKSLFHTHSLMARILT